MPHRCTSRATVRTPADKKEGLYDGKPWGFWWIEVLDSDANKVQYRVPEELLPEIKVGEVYDFTVDIKTGGGSFVATVESAVKSKTAQPAAA